MLCCLNLKLTGVALSVIPPLLLGAILYGRFVRRISKEYMDALAASTATASEKLGQIRTVKLFTAEKREMQVYHDQIEHTFELGKKVALSRGLFYAGVCEYVMLTFR